MLELWSQASHRHISDCHSTASRLTHSAAPASDWSKSCFPAISTAISLWYVVQTTEVTTWAAHNLLHFLTPSASTLLHTPTWSRFPQAFARSLYIISTEFWLPFFPCCLTKLIECSLPGSNTRSPVGDLGRRGNWDFWDTCWRVPSEGSIKRGQVSQERPLKSLLAVLWKVRHVLSYGSTVMGYLCTAEWKRQSQEENLLHKLTGAERAALLISSIPRQAPEVTPSST